MRGKLKPMRLKSIYTSIVVIGLVILIISMIGANGGEGYDGVEFFMVGLFTLPAIPIALFFVWLGSKWGFRKISLLTLAVAACVVFYVYK
jgi:hypothetical protein